MQLARLLKSKRVINLTNVDYVYNKNPKKFKDAKPIKDLTWKQFKKIIGGKWSPGANVPFDPIASKLAEKLIENKDSFPEYDKDLEMIQNLIIENLARIQLEQDQISKKSFTFYR